MRKKERAIPESEARDILKRGEYGVLSTVCRDGRPYGVPVNYCYVPDENCIVFHCAPEGLKTDNIRHNGHVSFVVVGFQTLIPERLTTHYESVVVTGRAAVVSDEDEKREKLVLLTRRLSPGLLDANPGRIDGCPMRAGICKISIDAISGKRNPGP